jgi:hypothetical protein
MSSNSKVYITDISTHVQSFDTPGLVCSHPSKTNLYTITEHDVEGYALAWSKLRVLATGFLNS